MKRIRLMSIAFAVMALVAGVAAASASAAPTLANTFSFGSYGFGETQFGVPYGIDTDSQGDVWIAAWMPLAPGNDRVMEFSSAGKYLSTIVGSGEHKVTNVEDVAVAPNGDILVSINEPGKILEFKPNGEFVRETSGGSKNIAVDSKGNLWVDDVANHIDKLSPEGKLLTYITVPHSGFEVDASDNLLVANTTEKSIDKYSSAGSYLGTAIGKGTFSSPDLVTVDTEGNIWVEDGSTVKGYTATGGYLSQFTETKITHSMTAAAEGSLWLGVSDNGNQIQKWSSSVPNKLTELPVTEPFDGGATSKANFSANWSKLGWAAEKGSDETTGWRPVAAFSSVAGAFLNSTITDTGGGTAVVATMAVNPGAQAERYFSAWLDASGSAGTREGYELRFTEVSSNVYNVTLSKWKAGSQTVLASKASYGFLNGNSFALVDEGGKVSAWTKTGSEFTRLLTGSDATFSSGNAGIEGSGNITRLTNFKAGKIGGPPDTTITGGSVGKVTPDVAFAFNSNEGGASFECALDAGAYSACSSPKSYEGLSEGSHTFKVRAVKNGETDPTPAERTVEVKTTAKAVSGIAVLDNFERTENPLATGKWTKTSWAEEIGASWSGEYHGFGANGEQLAGAYWNSKSFSDASAGLLVSATVGTGSVEAGEYTSLWLDMPSPGGARSGYEARFTGTNGSESAYKVEIAKWVSGTRTVLTSKEGFSLPVNTTFVLTETGGKLTLWTGTSSFTRVLSAYDSTYGSGYAGIEVNKGYGSAYNFRAGNVQ